MGNRVPLALPSVLSWLYHPVVLVAMPTIVVEHIKGVKMSILQDGYVLGIRVLNQLISLQPKQRQRNIMCKNMADVEFYGLTLVLKDVCYHL